MHVMKSMTEASLAYQAKILFYSVYAVFFTGICGIILGIKLLCLLT